MHHHRHALGKRLQYSLIANTALTLTELIIGLASGSLALLSDAVHNLGDTLGLALSYTANRLAAREPNKKYTFGYQRAEILAALGNALIIVAGSAAILVEALRRLHSPAPLEAGPAAAAAALAFLLNLAITLLLHGHAGSSMNVRAAYLHMLGDTLSSAAVAAALLAAAYTGLGVLDPLASIAVSAYIVYEALRILREAVEVLMEAAPIDVEEAARILEEIPGVANAHHCHAWRLGEHDVYLECHLDLEQDMPLSQAQRIIDEAEGRLRSLGVNHATIQLELGRCNGGGVVCTESHRRQSSPQEARVQG